MSLNSPHVRGYIARANVPERHRTTAFDREAQPRATAVLDALTARLGTGMLVALIGPRGTGKTQIGVELIREVALRTPPPPALIIGSTAPPDDLGAARYARATELFLELRSAMQDGADGEYALTKRYARFPLLVLDEIQDRGESDWEDRVLHHLIDARYGGRLDTVLIGNLNAAEVRKSLGPSVASRLVECGGTVTCDWESFRKAGVA